jgi:hypothetical protein
VLDGGREEVLVTDGADESDDFDAVRKAQVLFGDGPSSDTACSSSSVSRSLYNLKSFFSHQLSHERCFAHHHC